jgi:hypothetical protein
MRYCSGHADRSTTEGGYRARWIHNPMCLPNVFSMSKLRSTVRELCLYSVLIEEDKTGFSGLELTRPQSAMDRPRSVPARSIAQAVTFRIHLAGFCEKLFKERVVMPRTGGERSPVDLLVRGARHGVSLVSHKKNSFRPGLEIGAVKKNSNQSVRFAKKMPKVGHGPNLLSQLICYEQVAIECARTVRVFSRDEELHSRIERVSDSMMYPRSAIGPIQTHARPLGDSCPLQFESTANTSPLPRNFSKSGW